MSALRFIRMFEVKERTGLSKTAIYRRMAEGTFPSPIQLGKRAVAWRSDQLDEWITAQIEAAGQVAPESLRPRTILSTAGSTKT